MAYLYRHIRLDKNEPFYIGIGKDNTYNRAKDKTQRNKYWKNIISITDYEIEIIFDNVTVKFAKKKEKEFIKLYGRKDKGTGTLCNMTDGGDGCFRRILSEETKNKISISNKGKKFSEEHKEKLRQAKLGTKRSEKTKKKIGEWSRKRTVTENTRLKMSKNMKGNTIMKDYLARINK
jgi:hypothetical protein